MLIQEDFDQLKQRKFLNEYLLTLCDETYKGN